MILPDPLFLAMAGTAVASPGPGVVLTLSNALRYGYWTALAGILGITTAGVVIAGISATGLGLLLSTTPAAFNAIKYGGALYLCYLAWKLWRAPPPKHRDAKEESLAERYREALVMQFGNPQALIFFIALFPQFLQGVASPLATFAVLVASYGLLVVVIHSAYALAARQVQHHIEGEHARWVNRVAALAFVGFAIATVLR
jgi:threonine/homoserine/homoserine lactone efflux protein